MSSTAPPFLQPLPFCNTFTSGRNVQTGNCMTAWQASPRVRTGDEAPMQCCPMLHCSVMTTPVLVSFLLPPRSGAAPGNLTVRRTGAAVSVAARSTTANVTTADMPAGSGFVHVVDAVLLPFYVNRLQVGELKRTAFPVQAAVASKLVRICTEVPCSALWASAARNTHKAPRGPAEIMTGAGTRCLPCPGCGEQP